MAYPVILRSVHSLATKTLDIQLLHSYEYPVLLVQDLLQSKGVSRALNGKTLSELTSECGSWITVEINGVQLGVFGIEARHHNTAVMHMMLRPEYRSYAREIVAAAIKHLHFLGERPICEVPMEGNQHMVNFLKNCGLTVEAFRVIPDRYTCYTSLGWVPSRWISKSTFFN